MPLNNSYDEQAVVEAIASALETFYETLIEKIDGLNIQKVMKRKIHICIVQKLCRVRQKLWILCLLLL